LHQKNKFLSILAHDIRNPLSSIFGISEILVSDYEKLPESQKLVSPRIFIICQLPYSKS